MATYYLCPSRNATAWRLWGSDVWAPHSAGRSRGQRYGAPAEAELVKLSRDNLLRAFRGAEETATQLQKIRRQSFATIEELDQGKDKPNVY